MNPFSVAAAKAQSSPQTSLNGDRGNRAMRFLGLCQFRRQFIAGLLFLVNENTFLNELSINPSQGHMPISLI
jgi:hypothetical protein